MTDRTFQKPEDFAGFSIPAWTTVDFFDADGNKVAHFDAPRAYEKVDNTGHHIEKFSHSDYKYPMTAKFNQHEPEAAHSDGAF